MHLSNSRTRQNTVDGFSRVVNRQRLYCHRLRTLSKMFEEGSISARTGSILPLAEAQFAREMLAGAPHKPGKIVLEV